MRARSKAGTSMIARLETILRQRSASASFLAKVLYGEDTAQTRRAVIEMVARLKTRKGLPVESVVVYSIGRESK